MDASDLRRLALGLPETEEKSHFGKADFRVKNRIFATLPGDDTGVVKLTPEEQQMVVASEPGVFTPVKGGWGLKGWSQVRLAEADQTTLESALRMAWRNAAPAGLRKRVEGDAG
ncbi:MmcQ/YjbR family DNA-binding protein [Chelativorans salis]|uniref:MmcQ/YjbR family DNA-binding protein n=1 Tax=Chelativorans salis TaxID=2978478 RepID=A0ABT2LSH1_9HYPH|nr:MmcQ/YjbR family DNA-binding protein [Chelativorans sp. EGI FJ00035]MCT7377481.1 MmcQ/YjbR family DNA-binding protein [Chelativorans sp. EGI FJ00035]